MTRDRQADSVDLAQLEDQVLGAFSPLAPWAQRASGVLLRLLAQGQPVRPAQLAEGLAWTEEETKALLTVGPLASLVEWDGPAANEVIGFAGLTTRHSRHSLLLDGRRLSTWCAWDALCLPELLGGPATVESVCPQTGTPIRLRIHGEALERMEDYEPVMSLKAPSAATVFASSDRQILTFCNYANLLASGQAARAWISTRPGVTLLSVADAFGLARHSNAIRFGAWLWGEPSPPHGRPRGEVA